jgi:hypothetical protein
MNKQLKREEENKAILNHIIAYKSYDLLNTTHELLNELSKLKEHGYKEKSFIDNIKLTTALYEYYQLSYDLNLYSVGIEVNEIVNNDDHIEFAIYTYINKYALYDEGDEMYPHENDIEYNFDKLVKVAEHCNIQIDDTNCYRKGENYIEVLYCSYWF